MTRELKFGLRAQAGLRGLMRTLHVGFLCCGLALSGCGDGGYSGLADAGVDDVNGPGPRLLCLSEGRDLATGEATRHEARFYDPQGRLVRVELDRGVPGDGVYETVFEYDAEDRLLREEEFSSARSRSTVTEYDYDDRGRLVTKTVGPDSDRPNTTSYEYDDRGRLRETLQIVSGEENDSYIYTTNAYDSHDRLVEEAEAHGTEGSQARHPGKLTTHQYDAHGRLSRSEIDHASDGTIDRRIRYDYDELGQLLVTEILDADGAVLSRTFQVWDSDGFLVKTTLDFDGGGADYETVYTYGDFCVEP